MYRFLTLPRVLLVVATLVSAGCVSPIKVHEVKPPIPAASPAPAPEKLAAFKHLSERNPAAAAGQLLDAIATFERKIENGDDSSIETYNFLVGRFIAHLEKADIKPWNQPTTLPGSSTSYLIEARTPAVLKGVTFNLTPSDNLDFTGDYITGRPLKAGVGAPAVATIPNPSTGLRLGPVEARFRNLTALVHVQGNRATLDLQDPFASESVRFANASRPLAADFASHVSLAISQERIDRLGVVRLINPSRYDDTARLSITQPFDPDRIPVLFVHGLSSTPATWMPMYLSLMNDPEIRTNYQFWVFSYPSGYPFPYSASLLRKELDRMKREYPDHKDLVIIGHSMGGIISRLMSCDSGDTIWLEYFGEPPTETKIARTSRKILEDSLIFTSRPEIDRAIFYSAPHRGSELATNWLARYLAKFVRLPSFLADTRNSIISILTVDTDALTLDRAPSSIDTLDPQNRVVLATSKLHIRSDIPYHCIMGDRGKGDTPNSSDGVVAYWSSHLDGAVSERIVPSDHASHQNPEGIEEAHRILKLHLRR